MSDPETRARREQKLRNPVAKVLFDNKGAFSPKVVEVKNKYKRRKINVRNYESAFEEDEINEEETNQSFYQEDKD